ncbi:MAG: 5'/3'-nucleotidase SurE [Clostridia bacterium]|nr:5'/3'-nucleotidase SurE [Clostridia bacterium]
MYAMLTNDDGIASPGLQALRDEGLRRGHRILICAPKEQQSAASQRITLGRPLFVHQTEDSPSVQAWAIDGTPSDCVRVGVELADGKPDFCISGINNGENAGSAVYYSGTVAAAREAAMHHIPAFAASLIAQGATDEMRRALAKKVFDLAENARLDRFPRYGVVNVNAPAIPSEDWGEITLCPLASAYYLDSYERRVSPHGQVYYWLKTGLPMEEPEPGSDYDLLRRGFVTCTVLADMGNANALADDILML